MEHNFCESHLADYQHTKVLSPCISNCHRCDKQNVHGYDKHGQHDIPVVPFLLSTSDKKPKQKYPLQYYKSYSTPIDVEHLASRDYTSLENPNGSRNSDIDELYLIPNICDLCSKETDLCKWCDYPDCDIKRVL